MSDEKTRPTDTRCARLIALASGWQLFQDLDGTPYCSVGDNNEALPLSGETIKHKLTFAFFSEYGTAPGAAVSDALEVLISKAKCAGQRVPVFVRTGQAADGRIYLDLADGTGRAVEIAPYPDGWQIVAKPECRFVRPLGLRALPVPLRTDASVSLTGLLKPFLSCAEEDVILLGSWVVQALRPTGPYPICVLHGEMGASKSSTCRLLKRIVDPNAAELRGHPRSEDDYILAARNSHVLALDNLSHVAEWFSDVMCRVSTSGSLSKRKLYSDGAEVLYHVVRPQVINGIDSGLLKREDLISRAVLIECLPIPAERRRTEAEFWNTFEKAHPAILGAACDVLSVALANYETAPVGGDFRLSDFAQFLNAAEHSPKLGFARGAFVSAYAHNQTRAMRGTAENSPILAALLSVLRAEKKWEGTTGQLLEKLRSENTYDWHNPEAPRSSRALAEMLKRLAPAMRQEGLVVTRDRSDDKRRDRLLRIVWQGDGPQKPEPEPSDDGLPF